MTTSDATATGPLARKALEFQDIVKRTVVAAKEPGFGPEGWAELGELVAVDRFERIGTFMEVMDWPEYTVFMTKWAKRGEFATTLRRVSEVPGVAYLEIEERHTRGDDITVVNSLTVFAFDDAGLITHLDVYLQAPR